MGAQLLGGNSYGPYANMAAQHGGAGNRALFNQQTAPDQYQQGLDQQGMAINGLSGIMQALAYAHMARNKSQMSPGLASGTPNDMQTRAEGLGIGGRNPFHPGMQQGPQKAPQMPNQPNQMQDPRIIQMILQHMAQMNQTQQPYPRPQYPQQDMGSGQFNFLPMMIPGAI